MSVKLLIDMNLSPQWIEVFKRNGWEAVHWSNIGEPDAPDHAIHDTIIGKIEKKLLRRTLTTKLFAMKKK